MSEKTSQSNPKKNTSHFWRWFALALIIINLTGGFLIYKFWPSPHSISLEKYTDQNTIHRLEPFQFSTYVIPADSLNKLIELEQITFDPPISGKFRWIAVNKLQFYPDEKLHPASEYTITFTNEFAERYGFKWQGKKEIVFQTPLLQLAYDIQYQVKKDPSNIKTNWVTLEINFNFSIEPDVLKEHLKIIHSEQGAIDYEIEQYSPNSNIRITTDKFEYQESKETLIVEIDSKMTPFTGNLPMKNNITQNIIIKKRYDLYVNGIYSLQAGKTNSIKVNLNHKVDPDLAESFISVSPEIPDLTIERSGRYLLLKGAIDFGKYYNVTIREGLMAANGAILKNSFSGKVKIKDLKSSLNFGASGTFLTRGGNRNIKVVSTNIKEIDMEVKRVYYNNIVQWLQHTNRSNRFYSNEIKNLGNILIKEKIKVDHELNELTNTIFNVDDFVKDEKGIYQFEVSKSNSRWRRASQWVVMTDLGVISKQAGDELWVWVHSLTTTEPISKVKVELFSRNNQLLLSGFTDAEGKVVLKNYQASVAGFTPFVIIASKKDDVSFVNLTRHQISETNFDIAGRPFIGNGYEAYLYSDRGIYRPGDTAHLVGIVRQGKDLLLPDNFPVKISIKAPDKSEFELQEKWLNDEGALETEIKFPMYALTGTYQIEMLLAGEVLGKTEIFVEEFMPDRIKVKLDMAQKSVRLDQKIEGTVIGQMLYGAPASDKNVEVKLKLEGAIFKPQNDKWHDFSFAKKNKSFSTKNYNIIKTTLDSLGTKSFSYQIKNKIKPPSNLRGIVSATVNETGGRAVSAYASLKLNAYSHYAGIHPVNDAPELGQSAKFEIIVVDKDGDIAPGRDVTVKLFRIKYHWNYILENDRYRWKSERDYIEEFVLETKSGEIPELITVTPENWGKYRLVVIERETDMRSTHDFRVSGWGSQPWDVENPDQLNISMDKEQYSPGDVAKVLVQSPFKGRLILTFESDQIFKTKSYVMDENTKTISLDIKEKYVPNIYISGSVIRSPIGLLEHERTRAHGVVPLKVESPENHLQISINCPPEMRPNNTLKIEYSVENSNSPVYCTIAAVDEGILQLIDFENPDPYAFFYAKRALGVKSFDIYTELLPEFADSNPDDKSGGDAAERIRGKKHLSTTAIKRIVPIVMWSGLLKSDQTSEGFVEFEVPQFNGELRVMAVAFTKDRFGSSSRQIVVRDPIIMTPSFPRFISGNDNFIVPVEIFNGTGHDGDFQISLNFGDRIEINSEPIVSVKISDQEQVVIEYELTAGIGLHPVKAVLRAEGNDEHVETITQLPVRPPYPVHTITEFGTAIKGNKYSFTYPDDWYPGTADFHLHLTGEPELQYSGGLMYLLKYPYGCAEQTVSRLFPLLYFNDLALELEPGLFNSGSVDYYVNEGLNKIGDFQKDDGGFSFWRQSNYRRPWISIYITHFLVEAREAGFSVPDHILKNALNWCKSTAHSTISNQNPNRQALKNRVYANYVLAIAGETDRNTMNYLKNFSLNDLSVFSQYQLAACYAKIGDLVTARNLIPESAQIPDPEPRRHFHSPTRAKSIMLSVLPEIDANHPQIPILINSLNDALGKRGRWYNTQDNAFALLALGKYLNKWKSDEPPVGKIRIGDNDPVRFTGEELYLRNENWAGKDAEITVESDGKAYIYWIANGIPLENKTVMEDQGISVRREFYDESGEKLVENQFIQGELVVVKVICNTLGESLDDVIIVDLLPAGLEVENVRLSSRQQVPWLDGKAKDKPTYIDFRDDRVIIATDLPKNYSHRNNTDDGKVFYYVLRAITVGEFTLPPITAEAMYDPVKKSISSSGTITIVQP